MCGLCHNKNETIDHILSSCSKLSQSEYKCRHDNVAAAIHWCMCRKYLTLCKDKWYEHRADKVAENDEVKLQIKTSTNSKKGNPHWPEKPDLVSRFIKYVYLVSLKILFSTFQSSLLKKK